MKTLFLTALLLSSLTTIAQPSLIVNEKGIGDVKLDMTIANLEALFGQPFVLKPVNGPGWSDDTTSFIYKNALYEIILQREVNEKGKVIRSSVYEVKCSNTAVKTKSGISIGDDKLKIITTYEGYVIRIIPVFEGSNQQTKSKTHSKIMLMTDVNKAVTFYLINNKVTAISVGYVEGC